MEGAKGKKKKGKSKGEDDVKENGSVPAAAGEQNGQSVPGDVVRMEAMEIKPPEVVEVDPTCIQPGGECCVRKMKLMQIADKGTDKVKSEEEAKNKNYAFWSTQPVPQIGTSIDPNEIGPIEADKSIEDIRAEPYSLPSGFFWDTLDLGVESILEEVYKLLTENYVEDDDNMFRFNYSPEFLLWALRPPEFQPNWHVGVRTASSKKLVGFISGVPATIQVHGKVQKMAEINFLCVHKKLRAKRVTPVLIREITRRVNRLGIFQAVYTAGVFLPTPFATGRYYHRSLNPKKLVETGFSGLRKNQTLQRMQKLYKLPSETKTSNLRKLEKKDIPALTTLLNNYLAQFAVSPVFTQEEAQHWFSPVDNVLFCYVVEDPKSGNLTDMISFYSLPSQVMNNPKYKEIRAAYSFYNVHTETPLTQIMNDALILAKQDSFDVFNCLNIMTNASFVDELKFGVGDGNLHYYFYNFKCPKMSHEQVGLVLQ